MLNLKPQQQLQFPFEDIQPRIQSQPIAIPAKLAQLLQRDLTFKGERVNNSIHSLHPFAAKFPPQIPRLFIDELTSPGEIVLDPMSGSGTTVLEAALSGRKGVGVDIDPLSLLIVQAKTNILDTIQCRQHGITVLQEAQKIFHPVTKENLKNFYSEKAIEFFYYWFEEHTIGELFALVRSIEQTAMEAEIKAFLKLVFSSCIITKSGGLTRARDLAHSRPHRVLNREITQIAFDVFEKKLAIALNYLENRGTLQIPSSIICGDARALPLERDSMDLIVTSPPYAANAIDYMRSHKFSLIWLGYDPQELTVLRREYIGAELQASTQSLPSETAQRILVSLQEQDKSRASVVAYYFQDMEQVLREMLRVLKNGKAAILVVGSSIIRGIDIKVPTILGEIATAIGFRLVGIAKREISRNARMMPISHNTTRQGIEARMHEEGVIGLTKEI